MTKDETVGWPHQLNGHEFEQTLGDSEGQGSLACCRLWGCRVIHNVATEQQGSVTDSSFQYLVITSLQFLIAA